MALRFLTDLAGTLQSIFRIQPAGSSGAPVAGYHYVGEIAMDADGLPWRCTVAGTPGTWVSMAGGGGHVISDEGTPLAAEPILNFKGAGVTATAGTGETIVTIPGASGDVVGPGSAVDNDLAAFDGVTGKLVKDSGVLTSDVTSAVGLKHTRSHSIIGTSDHSSSATPGQMLKADASGLPVDASNTDAAVAAAVSASHAAVTLSADADTFLGLSTQQITVDIQTANEVLASAVSGGAAVPAFRALVAADIPSLAYMANTVADANSILYAVTDDTPAALALAANTFPARSSAGNIAAKTLSDFALTILDDADAATVRATIGAGTGSGTVTGSGTTGQIAKWSGATALGDAALIPPATNILTLTNAAAATLAINVTAAKILTLTATDSYALTVAGTASVLGTNTGDQTNISGNAATATLATNLAGGLGGAIPYQTAVNTTALLVNALTPGSVLVSNGGTSAPSWETTLQIEALITTGSAGLSVQSGELNITWNTTPQATIFYDGTHYFSIAVSSAGAVTFDAVGASAGFSFSDSINSPTIVTPTIASFLNANHTHAAAGATGGLISVTPAMLAVASAQYKYLVSNATPFAYAESGGALNITAGKTLTVTLDASVTGTNTGDVANTALTTGTLAQFAATTSAQLAGVISDETGTGVLVFGTAPLFKTTINLNNPADTFKYIVTPAAIIADRILNVPLITGTDTLAVLGLAQTFTGVQSFTSPNVTTSLTTPSTTFALVNATATTINAFGAATTINLGAATGTLTVANTTLAAKAITASTTLIVTGDTALNGANLTTTQTSMTALAGVTTLLTLGGTGASASTFHPSTLDATSSITGAIRTSGGISAAKALNVGTTITTGSWVRLSGVIGLRMEMREVSIAANGTNQLLNVTGAGTGTFGFVYILSSEGTTAQFEVLGGIQSTRELNDVLGIWSPTASAASSTNIYWSAGNNRYEIQNKRASTFTYYILMVVV